jgi:hypothetical protein
MRRNETSKSCGNGFVIKTLIDLKWEKAKAELEMAELKRKYGGGSYSSVYYRKKKLKEI